MPDLIASSLSLPPTPRAAEPMRDFPEPRAPRLPIAPVMGLLLLLTETPLFALAAPALQCRTNDAARSDRLTAFMTRAKSELRDRRERAPRWRFCSEHFVTTQGADIYPTSKACPKEGIFTA